MGELLRLDQCLPGKPIVIGNCDRKGIV